eukprot:Colp12_sorted_trinity150504_noHs@24620
MADTGTSVFATKAQVFAIDSNRSWSPISDRDVPIRFYHETARNYKHRIVSMDANKKVLINCPILPGTTFTKNNATFGSWEDVRSKTIYGLQFKTEAELNSFHDFFLKVLVGAPETIPDSKSGTGSSPTTPRGEKEEMSSPALPRSEKGEEYDKTVKALQEKVETLQRQLAQSAISKPDGSIDSLVGQLRALKEENEKLKQALAASTASAKEWEGQVTVLKANNQRLVQALQEGTTNAEAWKTTLVGLQEQNTKMTGKLKDLDEVHERFTAVLKA